MAKVTQTHNYRFIVATIKVPPRFTDTFHHGLWDDNLSVHMKSLEGTVYASYNEPNFPDTTAVRKKVQNFIDSNGLDDFVQYTVNPIWAVVATVQTSNILGLRDHLRQFVREARVEGIRGDNQLSIHLPYEPTQAVLTALTGQIASYQE